MDVIGIDSTVYARTDYDLATLQADFAKIAQAAEAPYPGQMLPLIVGLSMGAARATAVAGGPKPPPGLTAVGGRAAQPGPLRPAHRRQDERAADRCTFSMADFARMLGNVRVVQWHAELDTVDSRLARRPRGPAMEYDFPDAGHSYRHDRDHFVREPVDSTDQLLTPVKTRGLAARSGKP